MRGINRFAFLETTFVAIILILLFTSFSATAKPIRCLYFDQSHNFLFQASHMEKMLVEEGSFYNISSLATFPPSDMKDFDAIVLYQRHKDTPFDPSTVDAVKEYVTQGGGLYLVGSSTAFEKKGKDCPINNIVESFGYQLAPSPNVKLLARRLNNGERFIFNPEKSNLTCSLIPSGKGNAVLQNITPLVKNEKGDTIAFIAECGKGRVFLSGDFSMLSDYPEGSERDFIIEVMKWLTRADDETIPSCRKQAGRKRRNPELVLHSNGLDVYYSAYLKEEASFLASNYPAIRSEIETFFNWKRSEPLSVIATTGGGFTDPKYIGIGVCDVLPRGMKGFLLWEGVNSTPTPAPKGLGESWACFTSRTLGTKVGIFTDEETSDPWEKIRTIILADDPALDKFDISVNMHETPMPGKPQRQATWIQYRKKKTALLMHFLHEKYGTEFIQRIFQIHFAQYDTPRTPDFDTWIRELSLAAGEDLTPFFRKYGTTVGVLGLPQNKEGFRLEVERILKEN